MSPLVPGVLTSRAVSASQAQPILPDLSDYTGQIGIIRMLLSSHPLKLKLAPLPDNFSEFQFSFYGRKCKTCDSLPEDPAVCAFCQNIICIEKEDERNSHVIECGYGTGVFLMLETSAIIV